MRPFTEAPVRDLRIGQTIVDMHGHSFASVAPMLAPYYRLAHPIEATGELYGWLEQHLGPYKRHADNKALIVVDYGTAFDGPFYVVCAYHYDNRRFGFCRLYDAGAAPPGLR